MLSVVLAELAELEAAAVTALKIPDVAEAEITEVAGLEEVAGLAELSGLWRLSIRRSCKI
jgi:hypothetical protein